MIKHNNNQHLLSVYNKPGEYGYRPDLIVLIITINLVYSHGRGN